MNEFILHRMRLAAIQGNAVEVAKVLESSLVGGLQPSSLIFYFRVAFPYIPLRTLINSARWNRFKGGDLDDEEFIEMLIDWIPTKGDFK